MFCTNKIYECYSLGTETLLYPKKKRFNRNRRGNASLMAYVTIKHLTLVKS